MSFMTLGQAMASGALAVHRFADFELAEELWAARSAERFLGLYESLDEDDIELARVAVIGRIGADWFAGTVLVDGEGGVHDVLGQRTFGRCEEAERAWRALR